MNRKIKIGLLLFLVNGLWAMNRFNPLWNQSLSNLRRSMPSNASVLKDKTFYNTSGNLFQAYLRAGSKASGKPVSGVPGVSAGTPGAARRIALLEKKIQQAKGQAPQESFFSKFRTYDKKAHEFFKESFVGTTLLGLGVMIGGRSLYDKYVVSKDTQPALIAEKSAGQVTEPITDIAPEMPQEQKQYSWTDFRDAIADRWNALFSKGVEGSV